MAVAEKLAGTLFDAQVDLKPHQVEAALFAFKSPLSKGAIQADEVGLGKTIEAGLVLSQKWTERKRQINYISVENKQGVISEVQRWKVAVAAGADANQAYGYAIGGVGLDY